MRSFLIITAACFALAAAHVAEAKGKASSHKATKHTPKAPAKKGHKGK